MTSTFTFIKSNPGWRWAIGVFVAGRLALSLWAMVIVQLNPLIVSQQVLYGTPVLAVFDQRANMRGVFSPAIDGRVYHFRSNGTFLVDGETGSSWNISGKATAGPLAGQVLQPTVYNPENIFPYQGVTASRNPLLAPWQRFDANWYLAIAQRGYGTIQGDTHFPPLYPILIRVVAPMVGDGLLAAVLISNLALVAALALFCKYAGELFDETTAKYASICLLAFPTGFFLFGAYSEAPFLLVTIFALFAIHRQCWHWAGLAIFFAILLRLQGIALLVPFVYALYKTRPWSNTWGRAVGLATSLFAIPIYLFVRLSVGGIGILPTAEPELSARLVPPWENFWYAFRVLVSGQFHLADILNLIFTMAFLIFWGIGWRRLPATWNLYVGATFIVLTSRLVETQPLNSMSRYTLTLFPIFILLGMWARNHWLQRAILYPSLSLALFLSAQFVMWGWIG